MRYHCIIAQLLAIVAISLLLPTRPAHAEQSTPTEIFAQFKEKFERALTRAGADPQHETYHYVVLMNTYETKGAQAQWMRDVYYGLLMHYLVDTPAADQVSYVPFSQMTVRTDSVKMNVPFSRRNAESLFSRVPKMAAKDTSLIGGQDQEKALLYAIERATHRASTIYILLSDKEASQSPESPKNIKTTDRQTFEAQCARYGIREVAGENNQDGRIEASTTRASGETVKSYIAFRIFLPEDLTPLQHLAKRRDLTVVIDPTWLKLSAAPASPQQADTTVTLSVKADVTQGVQFQFAVKPAASEKWAILRDFAPQPTCEWHPTNTDRYTLRVVARGASGTGQLISDDLTFAITADQSWVAPTLITLALLLAAIIGYLAFVLKERSVEIDGAITHVSFARPLKLVGPGGNGKDTHQLLTAEGVAGNQPIAQLIVSPAGVVSVRGHDHYQVGHKDHPIPLKTSATDVFILHRATRTTVYHGKIRLLR